MKCDDATYLLNIRTICFCFMSILKIMLLPSFRFHFIVEYLKHLNGSKLKWVLFLSLFFYFDPTHPPTDNYFYHFLIYFFFFDIPYFYFLFFPTKTVEYYKFSFATCFIVTKKNPRNYSISSENRIIEFSELKVP